MNKFLKVLVISILGLSLSGCDAKIKKSYAKAQEFKEEISEVVIELSILKDDVNGASFESSSDIDKELDSLASSIKELNSSRAGSEEVIQTVDALKGSLLSEIEVLEVKPLNEDKLQQVSEESDKLLNEYLINVSDYLEGIELEINIDAFV